MVFTINLREIQFRQLLDTDNNGLSTAATGEWGDRLAVVDHGFVQALRQQVGIG